VGRIAFTGGRIVTMDPGRAVASVVVADGDRIVAVGDDALLAAHADADVVDLAGATLVPGFIDAHNHLSVAALHPRWFDVTGIDDRDSLLAAIRAQDTAEPEPAWIRVHGLNAYAFPITRHDLDAAGVDRPVIVADYTLHQCVVSSAALDALGIGRDTRDPAGGEIVRGASGEPSGLLVERAWSAAHAQSMRDYADPDRWPLHIAARARTLVADGITCVHDAACSEAAEATYRVMARDGTLPLGVVGLPHPAELLMNDVGSRLDGAPTGDGDERFRVGAAKLFADGGVAIALDTRVGGHPVQMGMLFDDLDEHARRAVDRGFRIAVHAMGNRGVQAMIDTCTDLARRHPDDDHRFRVEHAGVTSAEQWRRLAELDAVAVVQPGFVEHVGTSASGMRFDDHHWLAFAGLADAGVTLAGSSDDPCAPVAPIWGAGLGVDRRTSGGIDFEPEQSVPFDDWLAAYTRGAAFAGGQEHERGSITAGRRADFVVLDRAEVGARVLETWIGGQRAFAADAPS
jgi:predicted amidohydrolase YtcJ